MWRTAYKVALLIPAHNSRLQKLRARHIATELQENIYRHSPLLCAIALNCTLVVLGSLITIQTIHRANENDIAVALSDGFLAKKVTHEPPTDGKGQAGQAAINTAANHMVKQSITSNFAVVTTSINTTMQFDTKVIQAMQLSPTGLSKAMVATTGTGTNSDGIGEEGDGSESNGTDSGYDGSGKTLGKLLIKGKSIGVYLDKSGSMDRNSTKIKRLIARKFSKRAQVIEGDGCALTYPKISIGILSAIRTWVLAVDSITLIVDLQDGQTKDYIDLLRQELIRKEKTTPLYVISFDQPAELDLLQLIKETGGSMELNGTILNLDETIADEIAKPLLAAQAKVEAKIKAEEHNKLWDRKIAPGYVKRNKLKVILYLSQGNSLEEAAIHFNVDKELILEVKTEWETLNNKTLKIYEK